MDRENHYTEYKKAKNNVPDDMWPTVSAFANSDGGHIRLGYTEIKDDIGIVKTYKATGVKDAEKYKKDILDVVNNKNKLSAPIIDEDNIQINTVDGVETMDIYVPAVEFKNRPVYIKGNPQNVYIRVGTADQLATQEDLKAILRNADSDESRDLLDGFTLEDLNLVDLQNYKALLSEKKKNPEIVNSNNQKFLTDYGFMAKDRKDGKYKLFKGTLLLFGKFNSIKEIYSSFMLDLIVKHTPTDVDYIDRVYTSLDVDDQPHNIYSFFVAADNKFKSLIQNAFELNGMSRKDNGEEFLHAIREALVNSLVHADYRSKQSVAITWYDDCVLFENPGQILVSRKEYFKPHGSSPRNELIFQAFVQAKLGEHTGSGGYRISETAKDLKLRLPELESNPQKTRLLLWKVTPEDIIEDIPKEWRTLYKLFNKNIILKFSEIKPLFKSDWKAHKVLKDMIEDGYISKMGKGRATKYMISVDSPMAKSLMNSYIQEIQEQIHKN